MVRSDCALFVLAAGCTVLLGVAGNAVFALGTTSVCGAAWVVVLSVALGASFLNSLMRSYLDTYPCLIDNSADITLSSFHCLFISLKGKSNFLYINVSPFFVKSFDISGIFYGVSGSIPGTSGPESKVPSG